MPKGLNRYLAAASLASLLAMSGGASAMDSYEGSFTSDTGPIKVGIMHSATGSMAISERPLKDVMLMLIDEQNKKGGILGRKIEPIVVDPASSIPKFKSLSRDLLLMHQAVAVFGCWTSVSRKSVLPIFEEYNGLLFYPVEFEGEESSRNIIYTGATPNQQAIPAIDYLIKELGVKRFVLLGTDYVYPRTINRIMLAYLKHLKIPDEDIFVTYRPFSFSDWKDDMEVLRDFSSKGKKTALISTLNGDTNLSFYQAMHDSGLTAEQLPVMSLSISEEEIASMDHHTMKGHLAAWNYFMTVDTPENKQFIETFRRFVKDDTRVTNDPMEAHYIAFNLWVKAVEKAGSALPNKVIENIIGIEVPNLSGGTARLLPSHNITKPVMIGQVQEDGSFRVVWQSKDEVEGDAWSDYVDGSKHFKADWTPGVNCGQYDTQLDKCL